MDTLNALLEELEKAQLVRRAPGEELALMFKHALTQEAAYESLLIKRRREIHRLVGDAIEKIYPEQLDEYAALLASHYGQAGDDVKTVEYAIRAGDRAAKISAYREARFHFTNSLQVLPRLADTEHNLRTRIDTTIKLINVAWGIDNAEVNLQRLFGAEELAQKLPVQDRISLARISYWIGRVYSYRNEHIKAVAYNDRVMILARESDDEQMIGLASALEGRTLFLQGHFGKAVPLLEKALPHLEHLGDWYEWILAQVFLAICRAAQGDYELGRALGQEAIQMALKVNDRASLVIAHLMAARVEFMSGDLNRMLDTVRAWTNEAESTNPLVHYMALGFQAWAESRLGMHEAAHLTMALCEAAAVQLGGPLIFADWFAAARAEIELNAGDAPGAIRLAQHAVEEARAAGGIFSEAVAQCVWGQALGTAPGTEHAEIEAHLGRALRLFEEGDALVEKARTLVARGRLRLAIGELDGARADFRQATQQFQVSGLTHELEECRRLLESIPTI